MEEWYEDYLSFLNYVRMGIALFLVSYSKMYLTSYKIFLRHLVKSNY